MLNQTWPLRALSTFVVSLIAANLAVLVSGVGAEPDDGSMRTKPAIVVRGAEADSGGTLAVITTSDGREVVVDPSTPEGQAALADARARGEKIVTRPGPVATDADRDDAATVGADRAPASGPSAGGIDIGVSGVGGVVGSVTNGSGAGAPSPTVPTGGGDAGGDGDDAGTLVEDVLRVVDDLVEDVTNGTTVSVPGVPVTVTTPPVTVPPITVPTVTLPPTTVPTVTLPPTTVPPTTVPPVTVTVPPTTVPPITVPPATVPPTTLPPVTIPGL